MKKVGRIAAAVATVVLAACAVVAFNMQSAENNGIEITATTPTEETTVITEDAAGTASGASATETTRSCDVCGKIIAEGDGVMSPLGVFICPDCKAAGAGGTTPPPDTSTAEDTATEQTTATAATTTTEVTTITTAETTTSAATTAVTTVAATTAEVTANNKSLSASAAVTNSWAEGDKNCYQVDGTVKNTGNAAVGSWSVKLPSAKGITVNQAWNCKLTVSDSEIFAVNEEYNGELAAGAETTFGFIISTSAAYKIGSAAASEPPRATAADTVITPDDTPASVVSGGLVSEHGQLHLNGTQITDEHGNAVILKGMSTHGIQWFGSFVNKDAFKTLRDDWNTNIVRIAMYTGESEGYTAGTKAKIEALAEQAIQDCIALDMYVVMDWHVLADGNPNTRKADALEFFDYIADTYGDYPNIIYEICNEPNGGVTWSKDIKPYAEDVIKVIRKHDKDNLIIVGTPTWSQDIDKAQADPLTDDGVLYALHFYADTHKQWLRDRLKNCINSGLPVFVSEFGMCDASGGGGNNYTESTAWLELFEQLGVSYVNWALADKNETCCVISPGKSANGGWSESDLTDGGKWIRKWFREH